MRLRRARVVMRAASGSRSCCIPKWMSGNSPNVLTTFKTPTSQTGNGRTACAESRERSSSGSVCTVDERVHGARRQRQRRVRPERACMRPTVARIASFSLRRRSASRETSPPGAGASLPDRPDSSRSTCSTRARARATTSHATVRSRTHDRPRRKPLGRLRRRRRRSLRAGNHRQGANPHRPDRRGPPGALGYRAAAATTAAGFGAMRRCRRPTGARRGSRAAEPRGVGCGATRGS